MKKKAIAAMIMTSVLLGTAGCSADVSGDSPAVETAAETTKAAETSEAAVTEEEPFDTDALFTGWLPEGVTQVMAETEPNEALQKTEK